ncbi:hypothetical protein [Nocardia sp. NPDC004722]
MNSPAFDITDLVIAGGPQGPEQILVGGLNCAGTPGEVVAVCTHDPDSAAALVHVLAGSRRARYGRITVTGAEAKHPVSPVLPRGIVVIPRSRSEAPGSVAAALVVIDAMSVGSASVVLAREHAQAGSPVLLITADPDAAAGADRIVEHRPLPTGYALGKSGRSR